MTLLPQPPSLSHNRCGHFDSSRCRSCSDLVLPYIESVRIKEKLLDALLASTGIPCNQRLPFVGVSNPMGSRAKAKLQVSGTRDAPIIGLVAQTDKNFAGIELLDCSLHHCGITAVVQLLPGCIKRHGLTPYDIPKRRGELKGVILRIGSGSSVMLRFVLRSTDELRKLGRLVEELQRIRPEIVVCSANIQPIPHAIVEGPQEILLPGSQAFLEEDYDGHVLRYGPQSFSQVTPEIAGALYRWVASLAQSHPVDRLLDLYCGVGAFSSFCSGAASSVLGIEISEDAIAWARYNAGAYGLSAATFHVGQVEQEMEKLRSPLKQGVIINPPRRGIGQKTCAALLEIKPAWIIYSSCNPSTLFNDLAILSASYELRSLRGFDMFPLTSHMEVVAELHRTA